MNDDPAVPESMAGLIPDSTKLERSGTDKGASDGRIALRLQNRQRVLQALIDLVQEGDISVSMDLIVERSGVSERSIFRYFSDLTDLALSAVRLVVERSKPYGILADIGQGSLEHRVDETIATRLRVAARVHAFGLLARRKLATSPEIQEGMINTMRLLDQQFREQFAFELDAMSDDHATIVVDILITLFSFEGLEVMSNQLDRDDVAVADRWRVTMNALLA